MNPYSGPSEGSGAGPHSEAASRPNNQASPAPTAPPANASPRRRPAAGPCSLPSRARPTTQPPMSVRAARTKSLGSHESGLEGLAKEGLPDARFSPPGARIHHSRPTTRPDAPGTASHSRSRERHVRRRGTVSVSSGTWTAGSVMQLTLTKVHAGTTKYATSSS